MVDAFLPIAHGIMLPLSEVEFRTARSGGRGGQHVNKVETKVELLYNIEHSQVFTPEQKIRILEHLKRRLNRDGSLSIVVQKHRSQWQNKQEALERLAALLKQALQKQKPRVRTRPTRESQENRLAVKRKRSEVKRTRRKSAFEEP